MIEDSLRKAIVQVGALNIKAQIVEGVVSEIHTDTRTCTITREGAPTLYDVRLNAVIDIYTNALCIWPKVGSVVIVAIIENNQTEAVVIAYSEIDSIEITTGTIELNGGKNGGLLIVDKLFAELNKTKAVVNAIQQALTEWVPTPSDGGLALKTLATGKLAGKKTGDYSDTLVDTKVTH